MNCILIYSSASSPSRYYRDGDDFHPPLWGKNLQEAYIFSSEGKAQSLIRRLELNQYPAYQSVEIRKVEIQLAS